MIENEKNEIIPSRDVIGWIICIDYKNLHKATKKDHSPLPFIDQMFDKLVENSFILSFMHIQTTMKFQ